MSFRSRFGQILTAALAAVLVLALGLTWQQIGLLSFLVSLPAAGLLLSSCWLLLWVPRLEVLETGVRITNPFEVIEISWGAIARIDTKWALTFYGEFGKVSCFGLPAPGRHASLNATKTDGIHLPESSYVAGTLRPGDFITSDSGAAAAVVRRLWEQNLGTETKFFKSFNRKSILVIGFLAGTIFVSLF